ncbi:MAG: virulence RhuM family protein [Burkholderiales bacterium]|nr:virulence RhuM family protein [Burkholderiales bacterium]MBP9768856.1 virulence RhuM family protein [Burkholderiales bacterium]
MNNKELVLFTSTDGNVTVDVQLKSDTVWLTQKQISELFDKERSVVTKHINNVFKEQELDEKSNVQNLHIANSDKPVAFYSLDVIISVGYRVKSKRGVEFRKWANSVLKDYLLKGYALNNNLINKTHHEYQNLLDLLNKTLANNQLITSQGQSVINLINEYATTWTSLLQYDEDRLLIPENMHKSSIGLTPESALQAIGEFKASLLAIGEATQLFGNERNDQLQSILSNLDQTMFGEELYRSVEEKAANLFYMVIKDHPFSDGNKRIGSFLFLLYIQLNKLPLKIDNIGLTSLALLIAESDPQQKNLLIRLIVNLLAPNQE